MPAESRKNFRRLVIGSIISAMFCASAATVAVLYYADDLTRWMYMRRACSDNEQTRASGLNYIVRHRDDPRIVTTAKWMLDGADDATFDRLVSAMSTIRRWGPNFEKAWVRYLVERAPGVSPDQRSWIAAELARLIWKRKPFCDDPRIEPVVLRMLMDGDGEVRLNAITAAALLPDRVKAAAMLAPLEADKEPVVARHASIMRKLLQGQGIEEGEEPGPPKRAVDSAKELARLERLPTASDAEMDARGELAPLIRLERVRVSKISRPEDLLPVFENDQPTVRDFAVITAVTRFTPTECRGLAEQLIGSFDDNQRTAGAMLVGVLPAEGVDEKLAKMLELRHKNPGNWIMLQHYNMAMAMRGRPIKGFEPANLLLHPKLPKSTVIMGMMQLGKLEGVDWLLNPLGESPMGGTEGLRQLLDTLRYWPVFKHYFPDAPSLWLWADPGVQRRQIEVIRNWYLLNRVTLRFDPVKKVFIAELVKPAEKKESR